MRKTLLSVLSQEQFDVTNDNTSVTNVNNNGNHGNEYPLATDMSNKGDSYTTQHSGFNNKYYPGGTGSSQHSSAAQRLNFEDIPVQSR